MHCSFIVIFTVLTLFIDLTFCETSKESQKDMVLKNTSKVLALKEIASDNKQKQQPQSQQVPLGNSPQDNPSNVKHLPQNYRIDRVGKTSHSLTKLAKSLRYGFDPYFRKGDFEFESRPKPTTLVAFRKNGITPRKTLKESNTNPDIAEMQSPFNVVSNFWADVDNYLPYNNLH